MVQATKTKPDCFVGDTSEGSCVVEDRQVAGALIFSHTCFGYNWLDYNYSHVVDQEIFTVKNDSREKCLWC